VFSSLDPFRVVKRRDRAGASREAANGDRPVGLIGDLPRWICGRTYAPGDDRRRSRQAAPTRPIGARVVEDEPAADGDEWMPAVPVELAPGLGVIAVDEHEVDRLRPAGRDFVRERRVPMHRGSLAAEAALGAPPVAWLLGEAGVDARWCLIHATHMRDDETAALARSGAVAGLCPLTEADLGDGIFPTSRFIEAGGRFAIGSDSNVITDPAAELRQLETAQRLAQRSRNVLAPAPGASTGAALFAGALTGGAQALDQPVGAIAPGRRADIVVLDSEHPDLVSRSGDAWLDTWLFAAPRGLVRDVIAGGRHVVANGRHVRAEPITASWRRAMAGLTGG